jgi:prevent-host-death family protein
MLDYPEVPLVIVNATDLKNNLGKYLRLSAREEIIIYSNGRKVARLSAYEDIEQAGTGNGSVLENARQYDVFPRKASYEEFLELTENSEERYEYIDGEIYLLASPKTPHQTALGELHFLYHSWFQGKKCRPMLAPYDITLRRWAEDINVVQPDLMVICDLDENLNEKGYYMGVPALVVEIISESTRGKDLIKKLDLYMSTGVREYWIVNPLNREVTVYLFAEGVISNNTTYKGHESALSDYFPGLEASLDTIFA